MSCDKAILEQDDELFDIAGEVVRLAEAAGLTLGCAESCTGGLVSGCLTAIQGSSAVVRGGVVSYAIPVKHDVLGVPYEGVLSVPENRGGLFGMRRGYGYRRQGCPALRCCRINHGNSRSGRGRAW